MQAHERDEAHDAAGHAEHFLERLDRLDRDRVELALVLYREHETVRGVLERLPGYTDKRRVALALSVSPQPAYVLVTHEGRFVTCLAEGMEPTGCYVVSHTLLVETLVRLRADVKRELLWEARRDRAPATPMGRLVNSDGWIPQEDISALLATQAAVRSQYLNAWASAQTAILKSVRILARIEKPVERARIDDRALRDFWRTYHSLGHLGVLATAGGTRDVSEHFTKSVDAFGFPAWDIVRLGRLPFVALQTLHVMARVGRPLLGYLKRRLNEAVNGADAIDAALPLAAIGARHEPLAAEIRKVLSSNGAPDTPGFASRRSVRSALDVLEESTFGERQHYGAAKLLALGQRAFRPVYDRAAARGKLPIHRGYDDEARDPERDLCVAGLHALPRATKRSEMTLMMIEYVCWAARAETEDFYASEPVAKLMAEPFSRERIWHLIDALDMHGAAVDAKVPVQASEKPGRNDPCSCGSGKKYKKCCGG